jgi:hypothetical protein
MPQASKELRDEMERRFGSIDAAGPVKFLQDSGYTLLAGWIWDKPGVTNLQQLTRDEFECLLFLCHEWDFGGLAPTRAATKHKESGE